VEQRETSRYAKEVANSVGYREPPQRIATSPKAVSPKGPETGEDCEPEEFSQERMERWLGVHNRKSRNYRSCVNAYEADCENYSRRARW
jgi:hypothetical protein